MVLPPLRGDSKRFVPPTVEEVQTYCRERNNRIDAAAFIDFYAARGGSMGKADRWWTGKRLSELGSPERKSRKMAEISS